MGDSAACRRIGSPARHRPRARDSRQRLGTNADCRRGSPVWWRHAGDDSSECEVDHGDYRAFRRLTPHSRTKPAAMTRTSGRPIPAKFNVERHPPGGLRVDEGILAIHALLGCLRSLKSPASCRLDLRDRVLLQPTVSARVFVAHLLQLTGFAREPAAVCLLPAVERVLRDPDLPAHIADSPPTFRLLQNRGDLLKQNSASSSRHCLLRREARFWRKTRSDFELRNREPVIYTRDPTK